MGRYFAVRWIQPLVVALLAVSVTGIFVFLIGRLLLHFADHTITAELERKELWIGLVLTVGVLAVASFFATRPAGALGPLDRETAIGRRPMSGELPTTSVRPLSADYGPEGAISDLASGYTLYARNGALAETLDVLKSVEDIGGVERTLIYARGVKGAREELWIPIEAVSAVFPDSRSAFLAVAGDETEAFGWNRPPDSFSRKERKKETPLY